MFADGIASIQGAQELSDKIDVGEELTDDDLNSMGVKAIDDYIYYYNNDRIKEKLKGLSPVNYRLQSSS